MVKPHLKKNVVWCLMLLKDATHLLDVQKKEEIIELKGLKCLLQEVENRKNCIVTFITVEFLFIIVAW